MKIIIFYLILNISIINNLELIDYKFQLNSIEEDIEYITTLEAILREPKILLTHYETLLKNGVKYLRVYTEDVKPQNYSLLKYSPESYLSVQIEILQNLKTKYDFSIIATIPFIDHEQEYLEKEYLKTLFDYYEYLDEFYSPYNIDIYLGYSLNNESEFRAFIHLFEGKTKWVSFHLDNDVDRFVVGTIKKPEQLLYDYLTNNKLNLNQIDAILFNGTSLNLAIESCEVIKKKLSSIMGKVKVGIYSYMEFHNEQVLKSAERDGYQIMYGKRTTMSEVQRRLHDHKHIEFIGGTPYYGKDFYTNIRYHHNIKLTTVRDDKDL